MGQVIRNDVFLSYAAEDASAAMRVYEDLTRARLKVWRYEKDGEIGVDFVREYRGEIERSGVFCLLDSTHARSSPHVGEECRLARELIAGDRPLRMVLCVLNGKADSGGWRDRELFPGQNSIAYIDLTEYGHGIRKLCRYLGTVYLPGFELPRDQDVEREVYEAGIAPEEAERLLEMYGNFRALFSREPEIAEAQLRVLLQRCRSLNASTVTSPAIALGILLAEHGRHRDAFAIFQQLTEDDGGDPRTWAGLAGAQSYLGRHREALSSYRRCQRLMADDSAPRAPRAAMAHNAALSLLALGDLQAAWRELAALSPADQDEPYVQAVQGRILLAMGRPDAARRLLETAYAAYKDAPSLSPELVVALADCYRLLERDKAERGLLDEATARLADDPEIWRRTADFHFGRGDLPEAVHCLEAAVEKAPESVVYRAELALMLGRMGDVDRARREVLCCLSDDQASPRERYYRGLSFFLLGILDAAELELRASRHDSVVREWPAYREIYPGPLPRPSEND